MTLALLGAGFGSAGPQAGTHHSPVGSGDPAYRYLNCMRSHGVPNLPDPRISTGPGYTKVAVMAPQSAVASPRFKSAQRACSAILPGPGNNNSEDLITAAQIQQAVNGAH